LGGGPDDVISFTADLRIAKEISKNLRIVVGIAKGRIKAADIIQMVHSSDLDKEAINKFDGFRYYNRSKDSSPKTVFEMFRSFLAQAQFEGKHYDPLFFGVSLDDLARVNESEIGVLACRVDMSQVKNYLSSMEEYRAPPSAVQSVRKVIG
jgi:hypothetical protein